MFVIEGKVGLVTGGARGIGAAIVREFLQLGLRGIAILDINEDGGLQLAKELNQEFGAGKAIFVKADISNKQQFDDAFKTVVEVFSCLDIVVNNAVGRGEANWEKAIAGNFVGTTNGTILAFEDYLPKYKSDNEAVIINISSMAALYMCPAVPIYSASKSGIITLSRCLGTESHFNRTRVRVIALCPGYTNTSLNEMREDDFLAPAYFECYKELLKHAPIVQPAIAVAKGVVEVIRNGSNGSVWIVADTKPPYRVKFPEKY